MTPKLFPYLCMLVLSQNANAHDLTNLPNGLPAELAEEFRQLSEQLEIERIRGQIEAQRAENAKNAVSAANDLQTAAKARLIAVQATSQAEIDSRDYPEIIINAARIFQISNSEQYCDATAFAQYHCHGGDVDTSGPTPNRCQFKIDETICGNPSQLDMPMSFYVQYSCGAQQRNTTARWGANAYLTCR